MRYGAKGSDFWFWCIVKIPCILNYLKRNGILRMQNDKSYFTHGNFVSNPPSTVKTAKFDCIDLSGPPCIYQKYFNKQFYKFYFCFWKIINVILTRNILCVFKKIGGNSIARVFPANRSKVQLKDSRNFRQVINFDAKGVKWMINITISNSWKIYSKSLFLRLKVWYCKKNIMYSCGTAYAELFHQIYYLSDLHCDFNNLHEKQKQPAVFQLLL